MSEEDNVLYMYDEYEELGIENDLTVKAVKEKLSTGKYILCYYNENGTIQFFEGDDLNLGELVYIQKVVNLKLEELIKEGMFT